MAIEGVPEGIVGAMEVIPRGGTGRSTLGGSDTGFGDRLEPTNSAQSR
jgi:hypothetical protein